MISRKDEKRRRYAVKYRFHVGKLDIGPFVGKVAVHHNGIIASSVDFVDCQTQLRFIGCARSHMDIAQDGNPLCLTISD